MRSFLTADMTPLAAAGVVASRYKSCRDLQADGTRWTVDYLADLAGKAAAQKAHGR